MLSSFGLHLSEKKSPKCYSAYLKKRFKRIYPPLWGVLIVILLPLKIYYNNIDSNNIFSLLIQFICPTFWFIRALIVYYIIGYFLIKNYHPKKFFITMAIMLIAYFSIYLNFIDLSKFSIETGLFKALPYGMIFLFGIYLADNNAKITYSGLADIFFFILFVGLFYMHKYFMAHHISLKLQFFQQFILFVIIFYLMKISRSSFVKERLMHLRFIGGTIHYISKITFELYMVHTIISPVILHYKFIFPLDMIFFLILSVCLAAILNWMVNSIMNYFEKLSKKALTSQKKTALLKEN